MEPDETRKLLGVSPGSKLYTKFLNTAKYYKIMAKIQFTEPQHNRTGTGNFVNSIMTSTVNDYRRDGRYAHDQV